VVFLYDEYNTEGTMPVNYDIKGNLAKLLATENLIVENRQVSTASFNVHTRVLTLPMWDRASSVVYDLLVAHEVGHALFTPDKDWNLKIPRDYINITEDARIEKLMKRRFNGLYKTFYHGYQNLSETDFFELDDIDINQMSFADRVNLHFKIGNFIDIKFSEPEKVVIGMVETSETFDDAIAAAQAMYDLAQVNLQEKQLRSTVDEETQNSENSSQSFDSEDTDDQEGYEEESSHETKSESENLSQSGGGGSEDVITDELFSEKIEEMNRRDGYGENLYVEYPNLKEEDVVVYNKTILDNLRDHWSVFTNDEFYYVDKEFNTFMKNSSKEVNYLIKEFECRKAANAYSRSTVSRTGVIDTSKLHTYKYNEDIFKKLNIVPDGKNHGLIFVLDWSGSMCNILGDTVRQLINLIVFCRKVNIPFEVYSFTNNWIENSDHTHADIYLNHLKKFRPNQLFVDPCFRMLNIVSSKSKHKDIDESIRALYRMALSVRSHQPYSLPANMGLSGTPLCDSVVALHSIVPAFQKRNAVQKLNVIILTDGDTAPIRATTHSDRWDIGTTSVQYNTYLRCSKTGETKQLGHWFSQLQVLLDNFKKTYPDINLIGIRLIDRGDWSRFSNMWITENRENIIKQWKRDRSATITGTSFDAFFAMACQNLNNDVEFEVDDDATKAQIRKAFKKSLQCKALNKKILSNFIDLVV
jgi:hypothetical protein